MYRLCMPIWSFYNKTYIVIPSCTSDILPPVLPFSPTVADDQELMSRGVWDLNCLEVAARHTLQAAIVFLTKTVGKNVLMSVGAI